MYLIEYHKKQLSIEKIKFCHVLISLSCDSLIIVKTIKLILMIHVVITDYSNGTPLQYSCLENPMDGGAWWAAVHGVARSQTGLSDFTFTFHFHAVEK